MNPNSFVSALVETVHDASIDGVFATLAKPAGRRPSPRLLELSTWYLSLPAEDQARLRQVIEQAVHATLVGCLCVLDGARTIEDTDDKIELHLVAVKGNSRVRLNSPEDEYLHDKYQGLVYERVYGKEP
jgi:hypothetical protein